MVTGANGVNKIKKLVPQLAKSSQNINIASNLDLSRTGSVTSLKRRQNLSNIVYEDKENDINASNMSEQQFQHHSKPHTDQNIQFGVFSKLIESKLESSKKVNLNIFDSIKSFKGTSNRKIEEIQCSKITIKGKDEPKISDQQFKVKLAKKDDFTSRTVRTVRKSKRRSYSSNKPTPLEDANNFDINKGDYFLLQSEELFDPSTNNQQSQKVTTRQLNPFESQHSNQLDTVEYNPEVVTSLMNTPSSPNFNFNFYQSQNQPVQYLPLEQSVGQIKQSQILQSFGPGDVDKIQNSVQEGKESKTSYDSQFVVSEIQNKILGRYKPGLESGNESCRLIDQSLDPQNSKYGSSHKDTKSALLDKIQEIKQSVKNSGKKVKRDINSSSKFIKPMGFSMEITQEVNNMPTNPKNSRFLKKKAETFQIQEMLLNNPESLENMHYTTPNDVARARNVEIEEFGGLEVISETQNFCESDQSNSSSDHRTQGQDSQYFLQKQASLEQDILHIEENGFDHYESGQTEQEVIEKRLSFNIDKESDVFLSQSKLSYNFKNSLSANKDKKKIKLNELRTTDKLEVENRLTFDANEIGQLQKKLMFDQDPVKIETETPEKKGIKQQPDPNSGLKSDSTNPMMNLDGQNDLSQYQHIDTPQLSKEFAHPPLSGYEDIEYKLHSTNNKNSGSKFKKSQEIGLNQSHNSFNSKNSLLMKMKDYSADKKSLKFVSDSKKDRLQTQIQKDDSPTDFFLTQKYISKAKNFARDRQRNWDSVTQLNKQNNKVQQFEPDTEERSEFQSKEFKSEDLQQAKRAKNSTFDKFENDDITLDVKNTLDSTNPFQSPVLEAQKNFDPQTIQNAEYGEYFDPKNSAYFANYSKQLGQQSEYLPDHSQQLSQMSQNTHNSQYVFNHMVYMLHERNKQIQELKTRNKIAQSQNIRLKMENEAFISQGLFKEEKSTQKNLEIDSVIEEPVDEVKQLKKEAKKLKKKKEKERKNRKKAEKEVIELKSIVTLQQEKINQMMEKLELMTQYIESSKSGLKNPKLQSGNKPRKDDSDEKEEMHYSYSIPAPKSLKNYSNENSVDSNNSNAEDLCTNCLLRSNKKSNHQIHNPVSPVTQVVKKSEQQMERMSSLGKLKEIIRNSRRERSGSPIPTKPVTRRRRRRTQRRNNVGDRTESNSQGSSRYSQSRSFSRAYEKKKAELELKRQKLVQRDGYFTHLKHSAQKEKKSNSKEYRQEDRMDEQIGSYSGGKGKINITPKYITERLEQVKRSQEYLE